MSVWHSLYCLKLDATPSALTNPSPGALPALPWLFWQRRRWKLERTCGGGFQRPAAGGATWEEPSLSFRDAGREAEQGGS